MATKAECKTCSKCLWEGLGEGTPDCLSFPSQEPPPVTSVESSQALAKDREEEERELSRECNLQMRVYVYISIYM